MKTDKIIVCPGKIPIKNIDQPWYMPYTTINDDKDKDKVNSVLCENCYKTFGLLPEFPQCFKIVYGQNYICGNSLRSFDKSSVTKNNIRVSLMNPDNFFRYRFYKFRNELTFHIPKNEKYVIIIENLDRLQKDTKISVDHVEHNGTESRYYDKKYPHYLILDDTDETSSYNSSCGEHYVKFTIKKWVKMNDPNMKKCYKLLDGDSTFEFKLNFNNGEAKLMNNILEINKNLEYTTKKIIVIENFI